jgi:hypothetical protein
LLFLFLNPFYKEAIALSPSFELQEITDENSQWIQTYGNSDKYLKSNFTDILAVNYLSDGNTLNTTYWLASGFGNSSISTFTYEQPFIKLSYGMLIDADSNTKTGYNGADYDFYVESVGGKFNAYLYHYSSTGGYRLVDSIINFSQPAEPFDPDPDVMLGSVNLNLGLSSINYPSKYNLLFYSAESFKSNEVRQFTSWVTIPPPGLKVITSPNDIMIRQGEEQLFPARIQSTTGFSNDVINITLIGNNSNNNYYTGLGFNSSELKIAIERNQPPLFKIAVPQQTSLGIYTIPLIATIREPSLATITKPLSTNLTSGTVDPEFELSKKYPTVGYLTKPVNFTVTVIPPMTINDKFKDFWDVYGQFIGLFAGGFVGVYFKYLFDRRKKKHENE